MSARFRLTKSAANDLLQIADYISDEDPTAAERVVDDIVSAIEKLIKFPEMGRTREDLADRRHRVWPVGRHLIFYRPGTQPLEVVRIWSPARGGKPRLPRR
jgi:antitoxin ParD1/3/4/toxin ParE1/3/4